MTAGWPVPRGWRWRPLTEVVAKRMARRSEGSADPPEGMNAVAREGRGVGVSSEREMERMVCANEA